MKNTIRVRHNVGKTSRPSQAKTRVSEPGISSSGIYTGSQLIALTVFDHRKDKQLAGCDIAPAAWDRLCEVAQALGVSVGTLLENTLQGILLAQPPCGSAFHPIVVDMRKILELDQANDQNQALHILLMDAAKEQAKNGEYCDRIQSGIVELIADTHTKMDRIFEALDCARKSQMSRRGAR